MAIGAIIGAATTIGSGIFGAMGQAEENRQNKKAAKKQNKYNKEVWRFNNSEQDRIYDFKVEEQEIAQRNYEADLKFQEESRQQQWDYNMGIRDYQFSQEQRAYEESVNRATQQKTFNQLAEQIAMAGQQRFLQENLLNMAFTESQTMMDFAVATAGLGLKKGQAQAQTALTQSQLQGAAELSKLSSAEKAELSKTRVATEAETALTQVSGQAGLAKEIGRLESETALGQIKGGAELAIARGEAESGLALAQLGGEAGLAKTRGKVEAEEAKQRIEADTKLRIKGARSQATLSQQRSTLEALKLSGTARALGQAGRSARKVQQGITAEAGANQAAVTAQYLLSKEAALQNQFFDVLGIDRQLMFNNMDIDQQKQFRQQNIEQQLYLNNLGIRQSEQFQSQNIRQQVLLNNAQINQQQQYESQNIQQRLFFDTSTIDQQVGLESMAINQKLQYDQQNVVQQLLFTEQGIDLDLISLNGQLEFDKLQMAAARDNLTAADAFNRQTIKLQRKQADIEAEASIRLKPEIAPPLPKPMALPRREWVDIFRPGEMPEPNKVQAQTTNPYLALGQSVLGGVGQLAAGGVFDNMFNPGSSGYTPGSASNSSPFDLTRDPLSTLSGYPSMPGIRTT